MQGGRDGAVSDEEQVSLRAWGLAAALRSGLAVALALAWVLASELASVSEWELELAWASF